MGSKARHGSCISRAVSTYALSRPIRSQSFVNSVGIYRIFLMTDADETTERYNSGESKFDVPLDVEG